LDLDVVTQLATPPPVKLQKRVLKIVEDAEMIGVRPCSQKLRQPAHRIVASVETLNVTQEKQQRAVPQIAEDVETVTVKQISERIT